jgi:hypothetical protein
MRRTNNERSITQQFGNLRSRFNQFECKLNRNTIIVKGELRPTYRSVNYVFKIEYSLQSQPIVRIISPSLQKNSKGEDIPHMYGQKHLCLYRPKYNEFKRSDYLSGTIIPWISLWLYYYEQWHITGKWLGGGEHPK